MFVKMICVYAAYVSAGMPYAPNPPHAAAPAAYGHNSQNARVAPRGPMPMAPIPVGAQPNRGTQSALDKIIETSPKLGEELKKIFEYHGIPSPWNPLKDLSSLNQQTMPDPRMLYVKIRDVLKVFESLKEMISDELLKVETYVKRAKSYLKENQEKLTHSLERMKTYMEKIKSTKFDTVKNEYAIKFNEIRQETQETIDRHQKVKKWLQDVAQSFKTLF